MGRIGIMGGTFDPIHLGHLLVAEEVRQKMLLDKIIFIPAAMSPLKQGHAAGPRERYDMCLLATADNPNFTVSSLEIEREGISYTVDTIFYFTNSFYADEIFLIVGADVSENFHKWKDFSRICEMCQIVVTTRPKHNFCKDSLSDFKARFHFVEITQIDISSTDIREKLNTGQSLRYFLTQNVIDYINKKKLYLNKIEQIKKELSVELSRPRYLHSLSVMDEANKLGLHYGCDADVLEKLKFAGLLHDCAKNFCEELDYEKLRTICLREDVDTTSYFDKLTHPESLTHSIVGAALAKEKYAITDLEIISAIKSHTFGKPNMSFIEKVIYLADFIEPLRGDDEVRQKAKELSYKNIDDAMIFVLQTTIEKTTTSGAAIYSESIAALEDLEENYGKKK